jgi:hypothetical protein
MRIITALCLLLSVVKTQQLNRQMKVESFGKSNKINTDSDNSLVMVCS